MKTGVQQIMLGTVCKSEAQALETLKAIKAAGYDSIELNSFMITPTPFMVRMLTKFAGMPTGEGGSFDWEKLVGESGLKVSSLHIDMGTIKKDPKAAADLARKYNAPYVVITGMYRFDYGSRDAVMGLCNDLNEAGKALKEEGISLLYHNHNCEFLRFENGEFAYECIVNNTDPDYVGFELDSFWAADAGVNPLELMDLLGNRMKLYHINDRGSRVSGPVMTPILKSDSMELGAGAMNLDALVDKAVSYGVDTIILESHKNWIDKSPIKCIQISGEWLRKKLG